MQCAWTALYDIPVKVNGGLEYLIPVIGVVNVTDGNICTPIAVGNVSSQATPGEVLIHYSP